MQLNLQRQLTVFEWLQMPKEIQELFKKWFNIPRSGGAVVIANRVVSDGHTNEDLSAVSLASLQAFNHSTETHWDNLLQETINKMENYIDGNPIVESQPTEPDRAEQGTTHRPGRPKKVKETA